MLSNDLLWFLWVIGFHGVALFMYKMFRKEGLYALVVINIILGNIQVMKLIPIFGMTATLGNVMFANIFWVTGMLAEIYGPKEAKKAITLSIMTLLITVFSMDVAILFKPSRFDDMHMSLVNVFSPLHRVAAASIIAMIVSQFHELWVRMLLKKKMNDRDLWLRSNFSLVSAYAIDTVIFCIGAFGLRVETSRLLQIILTTFIMKLLIGIVHTPFLYWGKSLAISIGEYFPQKNEV